MRIIVYGAGGIGSVVGGHLWRSGQDVILIGRPNHVQAIRSHGLKLIAPEQTYILPVPAVTAPDQIDFNPRDVVFLTMKGQHTEDAVTQLKKVCPDIPVFCLQNGIRNEEITTRYFSRVYGAMVRIGAEYFTPGEAICRRDPPGWLIIGRYPDGKDEICEEVAGVLRKGGFLVRTADSVIPYKWGKLLINLSNAIEGITGARGREVEPLFQAAAREFTEVLAQAGIAWISQEDSIKDWPEVLQPPRAVLKTTGFSSTWQSLERGQGSVETDFLNGEIVRVAARLGRQAPVNATLCRLSQEMAANHEQPGRYTAAQLKSLLGLE